MTEPGGIAVTTDKRAESAIISDHPSAMKALDWLKVLGFAMGIFLLSLYAMIEAVVFAARRLGLCVPELLGLECNERLFMDPPGIPWGMVVASAVLLVPGMIGRGVAADLVRAIASTFRAAAMRLAPGGK